MANALLALAAFNYVFNTSFVCCHGVLWPTDTEDIAGRDACVYLIIITCVFTKLYDSVQYIYIATMTKFSVKNKESTKAVNSMKIHLQLFTLPWRETDKLWSNQNPANT